MKTLPGIFICACAALVVSFPGCGQKKQKPETETSVTVIPHEFDRYSYKVAAFKSNVSWSDDDTRWQSVSEGLRIQKGAWVETGLLSGATIEGSLGDVVLLGERTKVQLLTEELEKQGAGSSLASRGIALFKGMARFAVAKEHGSYVVETPSARINVKGTVFTVAYHEKTGSTDVAVREGEVYVNNLKQPQKSYSLGVGRIVTGVGTPTPVERNMTVADSAEFPAARPPSQSDAESVGPVSKPGKSDAEARKSLEKAAAMNSSRTIDSPRSSASSALDRERARSQAAADSVRAANAVAVKAARDTIAAAKAHAAKTIDSTRSTGQSALDKEREKYRSTAGAERGSSAGKSDDAFDELNKRKGNE